MSFAIEPGTITHGIQLAVAPVFLLTAVAGMIGAVAGRLARIIDRARVVEDRARNSSDTEHHDRAMLELGYLRTRGRLANACIGLLTLCGFLIWVSHRVRMRFGLTEELPQHPRAVDMLRFALRKLGPWLIALVITVYLSYALPSSLGKSLAMVLAYALVVGTCFSAICVIAFSVLDGPHRHRALYILRHQAFRPLWLIGSFAAFGEALSDPRLTEALGTHLAHSAATVANVLAALSTGVFILRFRRPIAHLIRNQPLSRRLTRRALSDTIEIIGTFWYLPALLLVGISLFATFVSA
eukprot:gene44087-54787_t